MTSLVKKSIAIIDFGGQYAHLIASRIRRLGAYSEIFDPQSVDVKTLLDRCAGIIYSGGPSSVYSKEAPISDPALLQTRLPILGICYGHQLIMHQLGGTVERSSSREYGRAKITLEKDIAIFEGEDLRSHDVVWMSHGDEVTQLPDGFETLASTSDCKFTAVGDVAKNIYGIQFHPEVKHSERGDDYLRNFIKICNIEGTWDLKSFMESEILEIQEKVRDKKVFLLCSGGVDSTVAFALLARALPADHLKGLLIDTGFMRLDEAREVLQALKKHGIHLDVVDAGHRYFDSLEKIYNPEEKRNIIGSLFVDVQADALSSMGLNAQDWYLGQGTIYPDTIESGSTKHSSKIKTHHNRVAAIEELMKAGRIVEPLSHLYKDEVRDLGRLLGLPDELVDRHPFPGPGLAVRCLCVEYEIENSKEELLTIQTIENKNSKELQNERYQNLNFKILPVKSVGVQGDQRTYARPLVIFPQNKKAVDWEACIELATLIPNIFPMVNRALLCIAKSADYDLDKNLELVFPVHLESHRIEVLQIADHIVHEFQVEHNIYKEIWQFPVVLVPVKANPNSIKESIILRPIMSTDAMTANAYPMKEEFRDELATKLMATGHFDFVFYDLTSKPPGTIEWE